jgi:hypothetical protein
MAPGGRVRPQAAKRVVAQDVRTTRVTRSKKNLEASVVSTSSKVQGEPNIQNHPTCSTEEGANNFDVNYLLKLSSMISSNYVSCIAVDAAHNECPNVCNAASVIDHNMTLATSNDPTSNVDNQNEENHGVPNSSGMSTLI